MRTATVHTVVNSSNPLRQVPSVDREKPLRLLRKTLFALVTLLVFEGLLRKLEPNKIGVLIFLLKDVVILFMGFQMATRHRLPQAISFLWTAYVVAIVFFLPCIIITAIHDPLLAIFGAKQYLLYPIVAFAVSVVFENATLTEIMGFCRFVSLLMIPAGLVALLQTTLPASSWLNLSVDGGSLENFSSGGHLRVSSTFSFVSQFCTFLNMEMFMIFLALHGWRSLKPSRKWLYLFPIPLVVICSYLTGSRGAVVGNTMVLVIATGLSFMRFEAGKILRLICIGMAIVAVILVFQYVSPSLMSTYSVREKGHVLGVSSEVQDRVFDAFFGWINDAGKVPFLGYGLGIMSNGSDAISSYSRSFRLQEWTETDFATSLFEGGPYLILVWYSFRYYIIFTTMRRFLFGVSRDLSLPGAFCQGFVILVGLTGTLGIQPPIAIWWWLAVGLSTILWWRSVHPIEPVADSTASIQTTSVRPNSSPSPALVQARTKARTIRGRSAYAERLHEDK